MDLSLPKPATFGFLLAAIAVAGIAAVLYSTVWGPGLVYDSYEYIGTAKNIAAGRGIGFPVGDTPVEPLTHYPPMFPISLAIFEVIGIDAFTGARLVNAGLMAINIVMLSLSILSITHSYKFSLFAALLGLGSAMAIETHSWVMSEPLYISLSLSGFLVLSRYLRTPKLSLVILSALLVGLASLTRYVGISAVAAGILSLLLFSNLPKGNRLFHLAVFGGISLMPLVLWTVRIFYQTKIIYDRNPGLYPLTPKNYNSAMTTMLSWFLPEPLIAGYIKELILILFVVCLGVGFAYFMSTRLGLPSASKLSLLLGKSPQLFGIHTLYFFLYFGTVLFSKSLLDPKIGLNDRILSPLYYSLSILLLTIFAGVWELRSKPARLSIVVLCLLLLSYIVSQSVPVVRRFHLQGLGIVSRKAYHESEVIKAIQELSAKMPVYSNSQSTVYLWTGRTGYMLGDFEQMKIQGGVEPAALVLFRYHYSRDCGECLIQGLELYKKDRIGSIYLYSP